MQVVSAHEGTLLPRVAPMLLLCDGAAAAMLVDHGSMHGEDLEHVPDQVRRAARDGQNGEIEWPLPLARAAVGA